MERAGKDLGNELKHLDVAEYSIVNGEGVSKKVFEVYDVKRIQIHRLGQKRFREFKSALEKELEYPNYTLKSGVVIFK